MYGMTYGWVPMPLGGSSVATKCMGKILDDTIAEVSALLRQPVTVLPRVVEGNPAQVLLAAATGAAMLVVGSRGHSTLAEHRARLRQPALRAAHTEGLWRHSGVVHHPPRAPKPFEPPSHRPRRSS